jgi:hypothetical protein
MSMTVDHDKAGGGTGDVDLKLEAVVIPVADVDRAKPGCSAQFGARITSAGPGSAQGLYLGTELPG